MTENYLAETPILDYNSRALQDLIDARGWRDLDPYDQIGAAYDFVRNEIKFGYNSSDDIPASHVLSDGIGQCNTKTTLLMALLRGLGIPCKFRGFTIHKSLQRGVVPELVYPIVPANILHSWVQVLFEEKWIKLEGFILDQLVLDALQREFPGQNSLCAYGAGTDCLQSPDVDWKGKDTFIQKTGINQDFGVFDAPDDFYADHKQLTGWRGLLYNGIVRHWMNRRVEKIRTGNVPAIPASEESFEQVVL